MKRIRMVIQYDGTAYVGWQTQPNGLAVQERIERELFKLTGIRTARFRPHGQRGACACAGGAF